MNKTIVAATTLIFCMLFTASAQSDTHHTVETVIENSVAEFTKIHSLSAEQQKEMIDILKAGARKRNKILEEHGISMDSDTKKRLSLREKLALQKDMKAFRQSQDLALSGLLSDTQLEAWKAMQKEQIDAFRKKLKAKIG